MTRRKTETISERISSDDVDESLLKKAQAQWFHDDFRKRVLDLVCEHEGTRIFEEAVSEVVTRYLKIKTSERVFWILGIIVATVVGYYISK